jgi:hypothetical protein
MAGDFVWGILLTIWEGLVYLHKFARYKNEVNFIVYLYKLKPTETVLRVLEL